MPGAITQCPVQKLSAPIKVPIADPRLREGGRGAFHVAQVLPRKISCHLGRGTGFAREQDARLQERGTIIARA